ncbi:MAG: Uncharacterized protein G01um101420_589 [Parcubacteria group bacterium Gr01-1014_20]|nr:MAG: Uncharacterized protein G01um101420_589 [Parcubacteria group bacterium Gr01-1014_20]
MNKRSIIIAAVVVIVLVILVFFSSNISNKVRRPEKKDGEFITMQNSPPNVVVPEKDSQNLPENIAKPEVFYEQERRPGTGLRVFSITIEEDTFKPDTVIVNEFDRVKINLTSVDKDYDFTQPDSGRPMKILKGTTEFVEFQAQGGKKLTFYCTLCGGPEKGPIGNIIIKPKE